MKTNIKLLAIILLALAACGDNLAGKPDAGKPDGPPADAYCSDCPAAPTLGAQIDRMGRPAVNTALNHAFDPDTAASAMKKDEYNQDSMAASWAATYRAEFAVNLALIDSLDTQLCGNGKCESGEGNVAGTNILACPSDCPNNLQVGDGHACGNQVLYNGQPSGGGDPAATSYLTLASILANDVLFLDTSKTVCVLYLAFEFGVATGMGNTTCGGRAPQYDVIDYSLSALAVGIAGFSTDGMFTPEFKDNAPPHTDYLSTFPYLGEPHAPN